MPGVVEHPVPDTPFTDEVLKHVNAVAHRLARKYNRGPQDEEDIRSQFVERLMKAFPKYNPSLSCYYTFAQHVVERERGHAERELNRRHRMEASTVSLYDRVGAGDDDNSRWIDVVWNRHGDMNRAILSMDVRAAVEALNERDRRIAHLCAAGYSWTEIAEVLEVAVPVFFKKIKPVFLENFRRTYLGTEKTDRAR